MPWISKHTKESIELTNKINIDDFMTPMLFYKMFFFIFCLEILR